MGMKLSARIALVAAAFALGAAPASAQAPENRPTKDDNPGTANKLAAPGAYCKQAGASKKKAEGQKKSPFAECVVGQAKVRSGKSPREACKDASKKKAAGQKKSSYATCVVAAKNFSDDKQAQAQD